MLRRSPFAPAFSAMLAVLTVATSAAAGTSDGFRALLAFSPAAADQPRRETIHFTDLAVAQAITGRRGLEALIALGRRMVFVFPSHVPVDRAEVWPQKTGFALSDVEATMAFGTPPADVRLYRLAPAVESETLSRVWSARGFRRLNADGAALWGRGQPGRMDISKRDPDDPFGGTFGRSSFLLHAPPVIAESASPDSLAAAEKARAAGGLAARADAAALLAVLERGGGRLLQAMLMPEPAALLTAANGMAPYTLLLLADIDRGTRTETLLALAFADCGLARTGKEEIGARWMKQSQEIASLAPRWQAAEDSGRCVLLGGIDAGADNAAFRAVYSAFVTRKLPALDMRPPR